MIRIFQEVCNQPVDPGGLIYDPASVHGEIIKEEADYEGIRVSFLGFLGKVQIHMQLDVGFADVVTPETEALEFPTILDNMSKPCIRVYPPETVIAEKFQAMIALGMINSRMKDFYDLWFMAKSMEFDFHLLSGAIFNTFDRRNTIISEETPTAFSNEFADQKQVMWAGFLKKNQIDDAPIKLIEVIQVLKIFFDPVIHPVKKKLSKWSPNTG